MIFTSGFYMDLGFNEDEALVISRATNGKIDTESKILFGRVYDSDPLVFEDFTSKKKKHDTYKALVLLSDELGIYHKHPEAPLKVTTVTEQDKESIFKARNKQLERELKQERTKDDGKL